MFGTVTQRDHHSLVATHMMKLKGTCADGQEMSQPTPTVCAGGTHLAEVRSFLEKHYGDGGDFIVNVNGEPYEIVDIGMRMLLPRELFRAQGFPDSYVIDPEYKGRKLSKTNQVRMCGNSVCPPLAAAIVRANVVSESSASAQA
jgi:DNA (cytosine-5)-methyltransferase 1